MKCGRISSDLLSYPAQSAWIRLANPEMQTVWDYRSTTHPAKMKKSGNQRRGISRITPHQVQSTSAAKPAVTATCSCPRLDPRQQGCPCGFGTALNILCVRHSELSSVVTPPRPIAAEWETTITLQHYNTCLSSIPPI